MSRRRTLLKSVSKSKEFVFDKYEYYRRAVQAPDVDVRFIREAYRELRKRDPRSLREDFCGSFSICCEWVKLHKENEAFGVDLDDEPIAYGTTHYLPKLKADQRARIRISQENVLNPNLPRVDVVCAMNFSHYIFKDRSVMKSYFHNCHSTLNANGILLVDAFGGSQCQEANEEITDHKTFKYFWDQVSFDPISNHALFHIHFQPKGRRKIENVFSYDWRMWSIPEIREMMHESGFTKTHVYWEGTTKKGTGNGIFKRSEKGEDCQGWVAYVVGEKSP
ncbi:MAG: class I SAM-dependent methyltransferase [Bdellovibrionaceae bacterium]|nr:class I SAM-dependent methyltransferase [Pseudobdellovibrionaceae bacterium]